MDRFSKIRSKNLKRGYEANADVETMLSLWMKDNKSKNRPLGLRFVQMQKNNSHHSTIKCTPYFSTFGREMSFGLVNGHVIHNFILTSYTWFYVILIFISNVEI